jgi:hypothetical protein
MSLHIDKRNSLLREYNNYRTSTHPISWNKCYSMLLQYPTLTNRKGNPDQKINKETSVKWH